jgi:2,3-bisphosphoglycerate-dependent phosphoglycerate mutase
LLHLHSKANESDGLEGKWIKVSSALDEGVDAANEEKEGAFLSSDYNSMNGYNTDLNRYHTMLRERGTFVEALFGQRRSFVIAKRDGDENEDGWRDMRRQRRPLWKHLLRLPISVAKNVLWKPPQPGTLILIRHGQSVWNSNKTFTGWADPDLSELGLREVEHAARLLLEGGYEIDVVFTSRLKRAIRSVWIILQELEEVYLPVFKSWRLNERMYGALTGLSKKETAEQLGSSIVQEWRGSLQSRPPALTPTHPFWPGKDRKYADLSSDQIPMTESLMDCMERTAPVWEDKIMYELRKGRNVMVVAHANTLRGLVKTIDGVSDEDIREVAIPTGIPIIYKFDENMKSIPPEGDRQTKSQIHMKGLFLEQPGLLKEALAREEEWSKQVPGYNPTMAKETSMTSLERSLFKLQAEREMNEWAGQFIDPDAPHEDDGNDGNEGKPMQWQDSIWAKGMNSVKSGEPFDPDTVDFHENKDMKHVDDLEDVPSENEVVANMVRNQPCITSFPSAYMIPGMGSVPVRRDAVIVIIRHGKTEHNKLGLFTGWEDAPLAREGVDEAREAGRLLKAHGFEFDVVYTSWLSRAIETAWHVIDEMDALWLPIVKTWRLNERMYGKLTGLSKQMVRQRHGPTQFKKWRRGYKDPPPPVSSFSQHYPGNDPRYEKYLNDIRYSASESIIRSIEKGRPTLHRKLPKSESLKNCMDRTIPFFTERIVPEAIDQGKRVLISSSENAIRGLLMHLCEIPEDKITELEIPNGLPLVFDLRSKCVKLLDDGTGRDPLEVHNFGKAASYLFRPCEDEDGNPDEECDIRFATDERFVLTNDDHATIAAIKKQIVSRNEAVLAE